jgi:hypothetical protein
LEPVLKCGTGTSTSDIRRQKARARNHDSTSEKFNAAIAKFPVYIAVERRYRHLRGDTKIMLEKRPAGSYVKARRRLSNAYLDNKFPCA